MAHARMCERAASALTFLLLGAPSAACFYNPQGSDGAATEASTSTAPPSTSTTCSASQASQCDDDSTATSADPSGTTEPATATTLEPTTSSTATTATEPIHCEGDVVDNPACGGEQPYCIDGACVGCEIVDCGAISPDRPHCSLDSGSCVECVTDNDCTNSEEPACDSITASCGPCDSHETCPETACNLETGQCFPQENVLHIDNTPDGPFPCSDTKLDWGKTPEQPLCTLQTAIAQLVEGQPTTIKLKAGTKVQNLPSSFPVGDYTVAIVHYGNTVPSLVAPVVDPALTVSAGNTVFMHRINVHNTQPISNPLLGCDGGAIGARLWLDQQRIFGGRAAIRANDCHVHVRRSVIHDNIYGGIDMSGITAGLAKLWLENSYITANPGDKFGAIRLGGAVDADIVYSTLALNNSAVAPIDCVDNWSGELTFRNSVIAGYSPHFGAGCLDLNLVTSFESDATNPAGLADLFSSLTEGVFEARVDGPLRDVALWVPGDPAIDFDGTSRPTIAGAPDYAGADRPAR